MKEKKKRRNASMISHPGIEVLEDGIKTTGVIRAGWRCVCSPGGWQYGHDSDCHCACGCPSGSDEMNNNANLDRATPPTQ